MAITTVKRDRRWVFAGDEIAISADITAGNRYRTYLREKPVKSALSVSTASDPVFLPDNKFTPDVPGRYSIVLREEIVTSPPAHYSNDINAESVTVPAVYTYTFTVAERVSRAVGLQPDTVTLQMAATCDDWVQDTATWSPTVYGAITRFIDTQNVPVLASPTSDGARIASQSAAVVRAVADIGGNGNDLVYYGQRTAIETLSVMPWESIADSAVIANLGWTIRRYHDHCYTDAVVVHAVADAAHTIGSADCAAGDEPAQRTLLEEIRTDMALHVANNPGAYHDSADATATAALAALAALPNPSTLAARIARTNDLFDIVDAHFTRAFVAQTGATFVHHDVADNHMAYATYYPAYSESTLVLTANYLKAQINLHLARTLLLAANYHPITDYDNSYLDTYPTDRDTYIKAVSKLLGLFQAHVTNIDSTTGTAAIYHTAADWTSRTDMLGTPTDFTTAVIMHEALDWLLSQHASKGLTTHGMTHAGEAAERPFGIEAIHHAFRSALQSATPTIPANENYAAAKLVLVGGFTSEG